MKCVMTRGLYLRSDGRLPCYCGAGETVTLGRLPGHADAATVVDASYASAPFQRLRERFSQGLVAHPGVCDQCTYLDLDAPCDAARWEEELEWFHWEPTARCNLDCRWCHGQRPHRGGPTGERDLPLGPFRALVEGLATRGTRLGKGNICGVGEPTLNPDVWAMIALAKERLGGDILLSTNGNGPFSESIVACGLDKLKIAIDAVDQPTYERYRTFGRLSRVLDFTRAVAEARARAKASHPRLTWQYILFNYNDSDADLLRLQQMAADAGVDHLRMVYTRCDNYSRRSPADFPQTFPDITFFPIKDDSLLSPEAASTLRALVEAHIAANRPDLAAQEAIRLVQKAAHRLALGVDTYAHLLALSRDLRPLADGNNAALSPGQFAALRGHMAWAFARLAEIYDGLGHQDQARAYRAHMRAQGLTEES